MASQVTTKRGDKGTTVTLGGDVYSKSHPILECCGQIDSLRAQTGLCRVLMLESNLVGKEAAAETLLWLSHVYFLIGSQCNDPLNKHPEYRRMDVNAGHLQRLEAIQAELESHLRLPKQFIVSATTVLSAQLDVACTQARTVERALVALTEAVPEFSAGPILAWVNRLNDYLFLLARWSEQGNYATVNYDVLRD